MKRIQIRLKELRVKYGYAGLVWRILTKPFRILRDVWRRLFRNYHYVYRLNPNAPRVPIPEGFTMQHFKCIEDIPSQLLEELNSITGKKQMLKTLINMKYRGCVLCVGFLYDEPVASVLYRKASNIPYWFIDLQPDDVVFMRGGTVPAHRGKGLFACMHQAMASLLPVDRMNIYSDVSIYNYSSMRSVEKAGWIKICKKKAIYEPMPKKL